MSEVQDKIKKLRPNLKTNTIKQYEAQLRKLQKLFDTDSYDFLDDPKKVEEKISHLHYTSRRNVYNAVIILLMAIDKDEKLIETYGEMRDELNKQYQDDQASGKISEKQKNNYLVQLKNNLQYIFNEYKTAKKYKENVIDIPKDLQKILRMYMRFYDYKVGDVIFPLSKNGLTQLLTKYSMKYMNKKISSTMIRKSYLSSKYSDMKKEMEKDSKIMGHSVGTAQKVYVKDSDDMEEVDKE